MRNAEEQRHHDKRTPQNFVILCLSVTNPKNSSNNYSLKQAADILSGNAASLLMAMVTLFVTEI